MDDVRRAATWVLVTRVALATACVAGTTVGILSCSAVYFNAEDGIPYGPPRAQILELFVQAGTAEALVAFALGAASMVYAVSEVGRERPWPRIIGVGGVAGALHFLVFPFVLFWVASALDLWSGASTAVVAPNLMSLVCPTVVACVPLGLAFGIAYASVMVVVDAPLRFPSGATLWAVRSVTSLSLLAALGLVYGLQWGNGLEPEVVVLPKQMLWITLAVEVASMLWAEMRARVWLRALRLGRVDGWRIVPIAEASVPTDLAPWSTSAPTHAVVGSHAPTYRDQPVAVAVLSE